MGNYLPHRHRGHRPRRITLRVNETAPAAPDTAANRERIAREHQRQAQLEAEKRERMLARLAMRKRAREAEEADLDRLEEMARERTFPWPDAQAGLELLKRGGIQSHRSRPFTSCAIFWGCELVCGPFMAVAFAAITDAELTPTQALLSVTSPLTLDFKQVEPIIDFLGEAISFRTGYSRAGTELRDIAHATARQLIVHRGSVCDQIQQGERKGQSLIALAPDWFMFTGHPHPAFDSVHFDGKRIGIVPVNTDTGTPITVVRTKGAL